MKRVAAAALLSAPLALTGIAADLPPAEPCAGTAGREPLTAAGLELTFDAPAVTAPELQATNEVTGDTVTPHRGAHHFFYADLAPFSEGQVTIDLAWANPSDYDLFVSDAEGFEIARSATSNVDEGQVWAESVTFDVDDCEAFTVRVSSWAGTPVETLDLTLTVTPDESTDTGTTERGDTPTILYLAGDRPGQLGTLHTQSGAEDLPSRTAFSTDRPTTGQPNQHTRPAVGFDTHRNPFQPWWHLEVPVGDEFDVVGDASALVWLSSQTSPDHPATFFVRLFLDGAQVGEAAIDGALVGSEPRPFLVEFPGIEATDAYSVTLQVSTPPVVSSSSPTPHDEPGDLNHTVWYDSVQYPSRLILP